MLLEIKKKEYGNIFLLSQLTQACFGREKGKSEGQMIDLQIKTTGCCGQHLMKGKK